MAEPAAAVVRPKRSFTWLKAGLSAVGAAAVATIVVMSTTSGTMPADPTDAAALQEVEESPLLKLASDVKAAAQSGDASLVIGSKHTPDLPANLFYSVYSDTGQVFKGDSETTLAEAVARNQDDAREFDRKIVAAARLASTGEVEQAKTAMVAALDGNPLGAGLGPIEAERAWAEAEKRRLDIYPKTGREAPAPMPRPTGKELESRINSVLWRNATATLFLGATKADVRAGVLRLFEAMKDVVAVKQSEVNGQRVLTLSASSKFLGGDYSHVVTIDAGNGLPIRDEYFPAENAPNAKYSVIEFRSSRVDLADVAAGKI
ncbi:hypothetical protein [Lentzea sp. NPDC060358]|uniref:hypothetical protein n=1 Tax=Lentzea sp. NPDC060358 TaxID=3347103 RepID=UPI00365205CA